MSSPDTAPAPLSHPPDQRPLAWGAEALWRQLQPLLPGLGVEVLARIESTNSELLARARGPVRGSAQGGHDARAARPESAVRQVHAGPGRRAEDTQPCLLVAEHQTRGRGRLGRDWLSSAGASLTFSLSLPLAPRDWSGLSLAVGVALADALDPVWPDAGAGETPAAGPRIGLKWPNDLWLLDGPGRGRKLGGILIETVALGDRRTTVVGVGLNVRPGAAAEGDPSAAQTAGSRNESTNGTANANANANGATKRLAHGIATLQELDPAATAPGALATVALPLVQALRRFESEGFAGFQAAYARRDLLAGQALATLGGTQSLHGAGEGVGDDGALLLRTTDGLLHRIVSGEVSVRLAATASGASPAATTTGERPC